MPQFCINTNLPRANISADFLKSLSGVVSKLTGKPESYVAIQVNADQHMSFGGSTAPCAVCHFANIGSIDNKAFSRQVMDKMSKDLNIDPSRTYIFFGSSSGRDVGHGGSTFG